MLTSHLYTHKPKKICHNPLPSVKKNQIDVVGNVKIFIWPSKCLVCEFAHLYYAL